VQRGKCTCFVSGGYAEISHLKNCIFSCSVSENQNRPHNFPSIEIPRKSTRHSPTTAAMLDFEQSPPASIEKTETPNWESRYADQP
jgi:hypothetical protein